MSNVYVQFADSTETVISGVFGCPQDPTHYPFQATIDSSDTRYQSFVNPVPTQAQLFALAEAAMQQAMDTEAGSWGYGNPPGSVGSIEQAITYLSSANTQWKAEATALNSWRDSVWAWCAAQQSAITAGTEKMPTTMAAFMDGMPAAPTRP